MSTLPYQKLSIWQKAVDLADHVYTATRNFPERECYGLTSQLRRAAVSIAANIAEGSQRSTDKDFASFIHIARGSLAELETELLIAERQKFLEVYEAEKLRAHMQELSKMLFAFQASLKRKS